jgi:hypothetical protein
MPLAYLPVAPARLPPVNDCQLTHLRQLGHDARNGLISPAEAEWVLSAAGPLFDEVARWRAWAAAMAQPVNLDNVVILPAVRP